MGTVNAAAICRGPRLELTDDDPRDATAALSRAAQRFPQAGVWTPAGLLTYPDLLAHAERVLSGLRLLGVAPGEHAILQGLSLAEFFPAFWACLLGGVRPVVIAEPCAADQPGPVLERLRHSWRLLGQPPIITNSAGVETLSALAGELRVSDVDDLARHPRSGEPYRPDPDEVALVMLSSGSTGAPKAAQLTHRALAEFCAGTRRMMDVRPEDVTLNWLPVDHSGALLLYHVLEVFVGCLNMHLTTESVLTDPLLWLDKLSEHRVNHSWSPTFALQLVSDALREAGNRSWGLGTIRTLVCGGEQVRLPVVERFLAATEPFGMNPDAFMPVWGMAETTTAITLGRSRSPGGVRHVLKSSMDGELRWVAPGTPESDRVTFVAVGPPAPGAEVRIVDADDHVLPERRIGRLQVRSARVTTGYVNNAEATRQALPDGEWLRTGDLAFLSDGQVVITGREQDVIVLNGHNIMAHEVEAVASEVVVGQRVGACGVPNSDTGSDDLVVFVEGGAADSAAVRQALFTRLRLTAARVVSVPSGQFPVTGSGKVRRAELCQRLLDGGYDEPDTAVVVRTALAEIVGRSVDDHIPFYELGLTSVRLMRLRAELERRLSTEVPITLLFEHPTVAALTERLSGKLVVRSDEPAPSTVDNRIAIIGVAVRFPGARTVEEFWRNLRDGVDSIRVFDQPADPDVVPVGGVLDDADTFDPEFFGMSPREAELTHPAHRLFLECCHQALEHGGYAAPAPDIRIGVYAGSGMNLYGHQDRGAHVGAPVADVPTAMQATIGTEPDFLASRVAYRLGLTGPAIGVQTACSTSLVAVHLAAQALLSGDAELALAGAAAVRTPQDAGYRHHPDSILSRTGRCRPFDAEADGTVGGNGVAAVLLKRLDRALADGDTVHGVILGSAVTNDGTNKVGFAAPSVSGHTEVVRRALRRAGVSADTVTYVEAHGTGTPLGDPVEFEALSRAFGADTRRTGYCVLGSVKPNVGHLDSCAGMAGLIKTVLMLRHHELVPMLNLTSPNPQLRLNGSPFVLGTERRPWSCDGPRRAGVSSLGVGGTNVHVVLEEPPPEPDAEVGGRPVVVPVSARTPAALDEAAERLRAHLNAHPDLRAADVATTLSLGRPRFSCRRAVVGRTARELADALGRPPEPAGSGMLTFAFSGQGSAHPSLAAQLGDNFPAARRVFDECARIVGESLVDDPRPELAQAALFAYQAAWVEVWASVGVRPDQVVGYSIGEYAAMYTAGVFDLADGLAITAERGRLTHTATEEGAMVAVLAELPVAQQIARDRGVEVAAVTGAGSYVLSGGAKAIDRVVAELAREGVRCRRLGVDRGFHSALIDPILADLRGHAERISFARPRIPLISGVDGTELSEVDAGYLCRHARQSVRFDLALTRLADRGCQRFIEVGPGAVLTGIGRRALPGTLWSPSQRPESDVDFSLALAERYAAGATIDWAAISSGRRIPLPGHPIGRHPVGNPAGPSAPVRNSVRNLIAEQLGVDPAAVRADQSWFEAGADSLALMNLARAIDETYSVRVAVRQLVSDLDTPAKLAALIGARGSGPVAVASAPKEVPPPVTAGVPELIERQLRLTERLTDRVTTLMSEQLAALGATQHPAPRPPRVDPPAVKPRALAPAPATQPSAPSANGTSCDVSLYFFGDYPDQAERDKYALIMNAAEFADQRGFHALWLPERHFHSFGALFPNPSVLAAALAARTSRIRLHAGSVVLPLHHPIRVAEEWSVVDNLSGGRAGLCFASGWHARDFVFAPDVYGRHREQLYQRLHTVRRLWAGDAITETAGGGERVDVRLHPAPLQARPPMFVAVLGNPDSYRQAAEHDLGVVTNLMSQSVEQLADNIARYRRARAEHGLDPEAGRVVVLVHSYMGDDLESVRAEAFDPFCSYLRSSLSLFGQVTNSLGVRIDLDNTPEDDVDFLLAQAYQRYCDSRALIGTPDSCEKVMDGLLAAGANEIACFVDFGVPTERVLAGLPVLDELRRRYARPRDTPLPLTPAQRRIWFLEQLHPGQRTYLEPKAIGLHGRLDVDALRGALRRVVDRHPALRTVFEEDGGEPHAVVRTRMRLDCPIVNMAGRTPAEAIREIMHGTSEETFNLSTGPLVLARLLRLSDEHHILFLLAHHIVFDSQSTAILTHDLAVCYRSWPGDPVPAIHPGRPAPAASSEDPAEDLRFWRDTLAGVPELRLPTDHPRPAVRTGAGASLTHDLDGTLVELLDRFSQQHRVTPFTTLLSALGMTLSRFSGQRDFVLGTGVAGRTSETAQTIGMFVDTVPLRIDLSGGPTFGELAHRQAMSAADAYAHRGVPFDQLVAALNPNRDPSGNPVFGVAVEYETAAEDVPFDPPHLSATLLDLPSDRAPLDLMLYLTRHPNGLRCAVEYDTALFEPDTIRRLLRYFELVLTMAVESPDTRPSDVDILTKEDRRLLASWQPAPAEAPTMCLHDLVEEQVDRAPDAVALCGRWGELTYRELDEAANRIAHQLLERGVVSGDLVGVYLPRGHDLVAATLAILKSGAGFLPLDPSLPPARLRFMMSDSGAVALVTNRDLASFADLPTVFVEDRRDAPTHRPSAAAAPEGLAYCIYTSGSTGTPKGVLVPHRGPVNLMRWHRDRHVPTRTLQWASPAFDGSVYEIFTTLSAGAALVLMDDQDRYDPSAVVEIIRRHRVERLIMPFTPLHQLLQTRPDLPSLRMILSAGEATTPTPAVHEFLTAHPWCALYNGYGPTEASIGVTEHRVLPGEVSPPIGRPFPGIQIELRDAAGRPVPVGAIGEIHLGGLCVADGYLDRPVETAAAFTPQGWYRTGDLGRWRADGSLEFHGRTDDQVKIRGHRIEPGEIRHALIGLPGVRDGAVVVRDGELVAYVVSDVYIPALTRQLAERLPAYLVPRRWVRLDRLPLTNNGKLDVSALPEPGRPEAPRPPVTPAQRTLHALWCKELRRDNVGIDQSFFELGGHSLALVRLLSQARSATGIDLTMTEFYLDPTIAGMAAKLEATGHAPLTFAQRRLWQRHHSHADPSILTGFFRVDVDGALDPNSLRDAFAELAQRHSALRTRVLATHQEVVTPLSITLPVVELPHDETEIERWCVDTARMAADLSNAPLWRARLGRISEQRWVLVVAVHHVIFDGASARLFWNELSALYAGAQLPWPTAQYTDYARWEAAELSGPARQGLEQFWKDELAGATLRVNLPTDRPRPETLSGKGSLHHTTLDADLAERIRSTAAAAGCTPHVVLTAGFARWLTGLCGQDEVVLAVSSAKRTRPEHSDLIGYVGEAVPVRLRPEPDLFTAVARHLYAALDHQDLPFSEAVRVAVPDEADTSVPAVMFTVLTTPLPSLTVPDATTTTRALTVPGLARTELYTVFTLTDDTFTLDIEYSTDLFDAGTIEKWAEHITATLDEITAA